MKQKKAIDCFKKLSSSPYNPEIPKKHLLVSVFMKLAKLLGAQGRITPHLYKGKDFEKLLYEYSNAKDFLNLIERYMGKQFLNRKKVLDVGCDWDGKDIYYSEHSKLKTIIGFDLPDVFNPREAEAFALSKNIHNCFFTTGYAENIPSDNNTFDIIIMEDVLEHVKDPQKAISECFRVLRIQGYLIIKFPSFKGCYSHHLDRAINLPALHYILPIKIWAQGLNFLLLNSSYKLFYEPFDEIVSTPYCKSITSNLNGLDFAHFKDIINKTRFNIRYMKIMPFKFQKKFPFIRLMYNAIWRLGLFKEFLSPFIIFIGEKNNN